MNCKNCHTELSEHDDYCKSCGGKVIRNRLTFRNLFEHLSETFFNYDNKLLRTIIQLFKKPEDVIGGYISGVRKKYVNPISFFGLTLTIVGLEWLILQKFFPHLMSMSSIAVSGNETGLNSIFNFVQKYSSVVMMMLVPVYALISRVVFIDKKKYNYTEHIIAFSYMLALISLLGAILNLTGVLFGYDIGSITYLNLPLQVIYISYCFKRLYNINILNIIARAMLSFVAYMIIYVIIFILILGALYLIEGKESVLNFLKGFIPK